MAQLPATKFPTAAVLLLPVALAAAVLFPDGLVREADWHVHLCWLQGFSQGLREGVWYPRWLDGANEGLGGAVFLYYAPLSYYLGSLFVALGLSVASALKAVYLLSLLLCGIGIHRWLAPVAGKQAAAVLAALGAMAPQLTLFSFLYNMPASALAVGVLPWVALGLERGGEARRRILALSAALAALVLAHTITAFQVMALLALAGAVALFGKKTRGDAMGILLPSAILAMLMASVYLVPLWKSLALVHLEEFVRPQGWRILGNLLFSGQASAAPGVPDEAALFETPNALALALLALALLRIAAAGKLGKNRVWLAYAVAAVASFALMTPLAAFLYEGIDVLNYLQFGWRWQALFFLCVLRVLAAALAPANGEQAPALEKTGTRRVAGQAWAAAAVAVSGAIVAWNLHLVAPALGMGSQGREAHRVSADEARRHAQRCIWRDPVYRPVGMGQGWQRPLDRLPREPRALSGRVHVVSADPENHAKRYEIVADTESRVVFPMLDFAGWSVRVDGDESAAEAIRDDGRIVVELDRGRHEVELRWEPWLAMRIAGVLSAMAWIFWGGLWLSTRRRHPTA